MSAPKTKLWRKLKWWITGGAKRLQAAHLRRRAPTDQYDITPHMDAMRFLLGIHGMAEITIELLLPNDVVKRMDIWRSLSRKMTAPKRKV